MQCIIAFWRTPLLTNFSIYAFCCKWIFISPTYVNLIAQDNLFTLAYFSNLFPNFSVDAKKLYELAHTGLCFTKMLYHICHFQLTVCAYAKIFHNYANTNYISAENIWSLLYKLFHLPTKTQQTQRTKAQKITSIVLGLLTNWCLWLLNIILFVILSGMTVFLSYSFTLTTLCWPKGRKRCL